MRIVVLGLIATILLHCPWAMARAESSRVVRAEQDIRALQASLDMYRKHHGAYPTQQDGLPALLREAPPPDHAGAGIGYVRRLPRDPWGNEYQYRNPGTRGQAIDLWTYGADGAEGGEGVNADFGNWPGSFDAYHAEARRRDTFGMIVVIALWIGSGMLLGCLLGLPIYLRGEALRKQGAFPSKRAHAYILLYLLLASPVALAAVAFVVVSVFSRPIY